MGKLRVVSFLTSLFSVELGLSASTNKKREFLGSLSFFSLLSIFFLFYINVDGQGIKPLGFPGTAVRELDGGRSGFKGI
jgi:hypothetical protein